MTRFDAARREALIRDLLGTLLGRPVDLLPFDEVRERLRLSKLVDRGLRDVPVEKIVGTLGREREFNRAFLPRTETLRERWDDVSDLADRRGFPPVELYQVGDAYFVVDGHHRVSVAHRLHQPTIEARVKEFLTPVPFPADASPRDVLLKEGLADFLATTGLVPENEDDFRVTEPKGYEKLLEHISTHRYYRGVDLARPFSWPEAVASWRDLVYRPMVSLIEKSGVLEEFPGRTETDLYLFVMDHLRHLRTQYGDRDVSWSRAVRHFVLTEKEAGSLVERLKGWWTRLRKGRREPPSSS
ncbi:MAG: hypothetical protein WCC53_09985 [Thermoanaerobaculia bacterium]|jgi:hypothetical protein